MGREILLWILLSICFVPGDCHTHCSHDPDCHFNCCPSLAQLVLVPLIGILVLWMLMDLKMYCIHILKYHEHHGYEVPHVSRDVHGILGCEWCHKKMPFYATCTTCTSQEAVPWRWAGSLSSMPLWWNKIYGTEPSSWLLRLCPLKRMTALYLRVPLRITRNYWKMRVLEIPSFFVGQQRRCTMGNIVVWHQWILSAVHLQHILRSRRGFTDHWNLRLSRSQNSKATAPLPKPHVWTGVTYLTGNHSRSTERMTIGLRKDMERRRGDTETMVFFGQSPSSLPSKVKAQRKTVGFRPFKGLSR